jgi:hypothetical protein
MGLQGGILMAAQAQMMTHHDLETKIGGPCELREEDLEKLAGGTTPVPVVVPVAVHMTAAAVAASFVASMSISVAIGGW